MLRAGRASAVAATRPLGRAAGLGSFGAFVLGRDTLSVLNFGAPARRVFPDHLITW